MSKLHLKYQKLKEKENVVYLFKVGIFYLFLAEDAVKMSKELCLKCTYLNDEVLKCGFPVASLIKYVNILKEKNIEFKIIDKDEVIVNSEYLNNEKLKKMLDKIKEEDIEKINGLKALQILYELQEILE